VAILGLCFIDKISKHMYNLLIDKHILRIIMKERIKQLAIEANLIASEPNGFDQNNLSIAQQKFAELIVQECANMAESFHHHQYDFTGNLELHEFIKEHFGVE
jgi:hypothetical protein